MLQKTYFACEQQQQTESKFLLMQYERISDRPRVKSKEMIAHCAKEIFPDSQELSGWSMSYLTHHQERIALDLDIVDNTNSSKARILEFGSIPLLLTLALKKSGYNVTGLDIAPERYSKIISELELDILKCNIETDKLPITDNSFDIVLFNELFEHLRINPIFTLEEVFRVLKPGGILFLSTPNLRSISGILNFLLRNKSYSCCDDIYSEYLKIEKIY